MTPGEPVVVVVIGDTIVVTGSRMEPGDIPWKGQLAPAVMGGWWLFFYHIAGHVQNRLTIRIGYGQAGARQLGQTAFCSESIKPSCLAPTPSYGL